MFLKSLRARALAITALGAATLAVAPAAHAATGPYQQSFIGAQTYSLQNAGADPQGANNWSCQPTVARPRPIVLVHGTWENKYSNWAFMSPELKKSGSCIFALDYSVKAGDNGFHGTGSIMASAGELATFINQVLAATGASKVDIVGHSQGGMMPRAAIKYFGMGSKISKYVSLAGTQNGTTLQGIGTLGLNLGILTQVGQVLGNAASDQVQGSPFITALNAGGQTVSGITYTAVATKGDEVVTPYANSYITSNPAGASVTNIEVQNGCPTNFSDHLSLSYSQRTLWYVRRALGIPQSFFTTCDVQLPIF